MKFRELQNGGWIVKEKEAKLLRGVLFSLGVLCLVVGIVIAAVVETSYKVQASTTGVVLSFIGICIIAYIFRVWQQSENLRKIGDDKWITEKKERWKEKLRNKTELELIRELGKICSEKYKTSKFYWRTREKLGISPEMVLNSKKEAKRRAIMELLKEVYGWE